MFYDLVWNAPCKQACCVAKIHSAAALKIGQRVRSARQRLGISLEDLGELAEVSWTSIGKIERGAQSPNVETIVRLATALDVEPGTFLTGVTSDDYGQRPHRLTARDLINARAARDRVASDPDATAASQPAP
ncbi:hypothetical protein GCM10009805_21940 [Leucobacter chromiireducens subsp. solipictus]